ncbi:O-antigen translocase [Aquimarina sp. ERC-38]|uniref:O-antigen translocase n=1 Tax=Aquimarina sp. ERC-38 TaxID=2949996 RepID=UPI002247DD2A|nr:O-antigen translocase [Aquimarina sp. ERC-38]UZO80828.1 O-antigen translocase [Aquimarina sp. ERC-38]
MLRPILKNFRKNNLVKIGSVNSVGVLITSLCSIASSKIIALYLGAEGMAILGNLRNFLASIQTVATLGLYNGFVKYVSELKRNKTELVAMLSTSYYICFVVTMSMSFWMYFWPDFWDQWIFGSTFSNPELFKYIAIALPFYASNIMCLAIINGFSRYKIFIILNIAGSIVGFTITFFLIWQYALLGALYALVINPAISLLLTLTIILYQRNLVVFLKANKISKKYIKNLSAYGIMALLSAIIFPMVYIYIRNYIAQVEGVTKAGFWEAMQRISNQYMLFVTTLISLYLLPKLSNADHTSTFRIEVGKFLKTVLPVFIVGFALLFILKKYIISLLFTEDFQSMQALFIWQLSGDLLKIIAITIACQLLAKKMFWEYVISELLSFISLYVLSTILIDEFGFVGASMAHLGNFVIYLMVIVFIFRKYFYKSSNQ